MPSTLHGGLPPPGVWDKEGWALRRRTDERITADFITSHDGALEADFMCKLGSRNSIMHSHS